VSRDARLGVDAARTHDARVEPELRKRWLGETSRQRQLAGTNFTPWEEEFDAWAFVQLKNGSESEWHDGHPPISEGSCHLHGGGTTVEDDRLPVGQEADGSCAYRRLGFVGLEGPNAVRGLLGTEEDTGRTPVHTSEAPTSLERLQVTPHGHLGAVQRGGQLPDQDRTALTEGLHDQLVAHLHIHSVQSNINCVRSDIYGGRRLIEAVVFDVGGVLLDWNPRHLYRKLFADEAEMEWFLAEVCSPAWHAPHDRGVSTAASCAELVSSYPQFSELIWAWSTRSEEMVGGVDAGSVEILRAVRETGVPCYALTNMEAETYPLRLERFPFLGWFDGTVVSGREGVAKPEPAVFTRLLDRFGLKPRTTLMIDDTNENLEAAGKLGIQTVLFRSSCQLRAELETFGVLPRSLAASKRRQ
jgi:2-haloacid dehalogenase